jgi:hypothetical protein
MRLRSSAFLDDAEIPARHTCKGVNLSPQLEWSGAPPATESMLVYVFDPDAGRALGASVPDGFVHWLAFGLSREVTQLPEGISTDQLAGLGGRQARNDFGHAGYEGPCPPARHRYVFRLIALDRAIDLPAGVAPARVLAAIAGHVLAQADLTGVFGPAR